MSWGNAELEPEADRNHDERNQCIVEHFQGGDEHRMRRDGTCSKCDKQGTNGGNEMILVGTAATAEPGLVPSGSCSAMTIVP